MFEPTLLSHVLWPTVNWTNGLGSLLTFLPDCEEQDQIRDSNLYPTCQCWMFYILCLNKLITDSITIYLSDFLLYLYDIFLISCDYNN